jgi:hypothetical protein
MRKPVAHDLEPGAVQAIHARPADFLDKQQSRRCQNGEMARRRRPRVTKATGDFAGCEPANLLLSVCVLEAEAPFDAQISTRHVVVERRGDFDDPIVLNMNRQRAADAAIGTHRIGR